MCTEPFQNNLSVLRTSTAEHSSLRTNLHLDKGDLSSSPHLVSVQPHDPVFLRRVGGVEIADPASGVPPGGAVVLRAVTVLPAVVVFVPRGERLAVVNDQAVTWIRAKLKVDK